MIQGWLTFRHGGRVEFTATGDGIPTNQRILCPQFGQNQSFDADIWRFHGKRGNKAVFAAN
jgi:hypothetical protein